MISNGEDGAHHGHGGSGPLPARVAEFRRHLFNTEPRKKIKDLHTRRDNFPSYSGTFDYSKLHLNPFCGKNTKEYMKPMYLFWGLEHRSRKIRFGISGRSSDPEQVFGQDLYPEPDQYEPSEDFHLMFEEVAQPAT